ncbi:MAG: MBL fold metallo-hydrolase, partial [Pseudonocardiaceae bacterium]
MPTWICVTCGVQQAATAEPPPACPICEDERQYVGWEGQRWTTGTELARDRTSDLREEETDLLGIGTSPSFAIGQRALLVCTERGNVLWDCVSLLDDAALEEVTRRGGIAAICLSHPHFYAACVEWADAFDAPILIPTADRDWIQRPSPRIELFEADEVTPVPGVTLARIGGHFDG